MARPLRIHAPGHPFHVWTRGDNKGLIFHEDADYQKLLSFLERALGRFGAECAAYCMLDNHFHLLLIAHLHSVSRIMHYVNGAYAQWFNRKYGRVGHVFQGRFGSKIIEDGDYMLTAIGYIARNPVKAGLVTNADDWRWSSHRATCGLDPSPAFLSLGWIWSAVNCGDADSGRHRYATFVDAAKDYDLHQALFFGGEKLSEQLAPLLAPFRAVTAHSYAERYAVRPPIDRIVVKSDDKGTVKRAAAEAFQVHAYTLAEIGTVVGRDPSTISRWIKQLATHACLTSGGGSAGGMDPLVQASG